MTNPYQAPKLTADEVESADQRETYARERLKRPATALLIMSSIHSVFPAITVISFGYGWFSGMLQTPLASGLPLILLFQISQLVWLIVISIGAAKMAHLESRRMAFIGASLSCIPGISPFFVLGIPFGIWALVRLREPEVHAAFD